MMKYYKTENGYVASVGKIDGLEVAKEEFDKEMDKIKNGIENEPTSPTLEETVESLKEAVASQRKEIAYTLSLMPMETQATMIENDTNNILNNLESEETHE